MGLSQTILDYAVPPRSATLWWLGQAGLIVKSPAGALVAVDPYLTNHCTAWRSRSRSIAAWAVSSGSFVRASATAIGACVDNDRFGARGGWSP